MLRYHSALLVSATCATTLLASCASALPDTSASGPTGKNAPIATYPYPPSGVVIGQGWDTFNDAGTQASCVEVVAVKLERESFYTEVEQIQSTYSMLRDVTTSVSASYSGSGGKASARVDQRQTRQINTDDQNFLFKFQSHHGSTFAVAPTVIKLLPDNSDGTLRLLDSIADKELRGSLLEVAVNRPPLYGAGSIRLTAEAKKLLKNPATRGEFSRRCGEGFVSAVHRGVRIDLLLKQSQASQTHKDMLTAALSASGWGASGSYSQSTTTDQTWSVSRLGYRVFQEGGVPLRTVELKASSATDPRTLNLKDILPTPDALMLNPTAFRVSVVPYANIDSDAAALLPTPLDMLNIGDYYVALNDIYSLLGDIITAERLQKASRVDSNVLNSMGGIPAMERLRDGILADLSFLEALLEECYRTGREGQSAPKGGEPPQRDACTVKGAIEIVKPKVEQEVNEAKSKIVDAKSRLEQANKAIAEIAARQGQASPQAANQEEDLRRENAAAEEARRAVESYERYLEAIEAYQASLASAKLTEDFFYRFYWYLVQIPLTKVDFTPTLTFSDPATKDTILNKANLDFRSKAFAVRLEPWKKFFCRQKSEALCLPDNALAELTTASAFSISADALVYTPPPAPHKKKNRCKREVIKINC